MFNWNVNGRPSYDNAFIVDETTSGCINNRNYENKCNVKSTLRYTAQNSDSDISCYSKQADSFGDLIFSEEQFIDVIIESDGISVLSATNKAIIITLAILLIIIIALLIFLAWYFGWCCWKGNKKDTNIKELKVNDEPTIIEPVIKMSDENLKMYLHT